MGFLICLSGQVGIAAKGSRIDDVSLGRLGRLAFAFLVLERARPASCDELADLLWGSAPPRTWESSLRGLMSRIRATFAAAGLGSRDALRGAHGCYQLFLPEDASVDVEVATKDVHTAERHLRDGRPDLVALHADGALAILADPFLPGAHGLWVEHRQAEQRELELRAWEALAAAATALGEPARAVAAARRAVDLEPLRETAHHLLVCAHAGAGNRAQALRSYRECRELLAEALGALPSPMMELTYLGLLGEEPQPMPAFAAGGQSPSIVPTNLAPALTSFVGRSTELEALGHHLRRARLLTLIGPGGVGKSRLALELGRVVRDEFPGGVFLVRLEAIFDASLLAHCVLSALGAEEASDSGVPESLATHVGSRPLLLMLDSCEGLAAECASLASFLLYACPNLRVLATSRAPLRLPGEVVWQVSALALPPLPAPPLEQLMEYDSVRLFVDRATCTSSAFSIDGDDALPLSQICNRLDGMPLALELVASRTSVLSLKEIAAYLATSLALVATDAPGVSERHRSLRTVVDWSYETLSSEEQRLFCRLSVFSGGCSLAAVEQVCAEGSAGAVTALPQLTSLVEKSMVVASTGGSAARYRMLDTLRLYAEERLAEVGARDALRDRHLQWIAALADAAERELSGRKQASWLDLLDLEHDNARAGLQWSLSSGQWSQGLRLATAMARFWEVRGHLSEGYGWLVALLEAGPSPDPLRALALSAAGNLSAQRGEAGTARRMYGESLEIRVRLGDRLGAAGVLLGLGNLAVEAQDHPLARAHYRSCLAIGHELDDQRVVGAALGNLGSLAQRDGDFEEARRLYDQSLALREMLGDSHGVAECLGNLGFLVLALGDCAEARRFGERSLAMRQELGDKVGMIDVLEVLGTAASWAGDDIGARAFYTERMALARELQNESVVAASAEGLGEVLARLGDHDGGRQLLYEALSIRRRRGEHAAAGTLSVALSALPC